MCVIRLEEKRAELERRGMSLSHIRSVGEPLRLGQLRGNHFDLVVRDLRPHRHCSGTSGRDRLATLIKEAVENVEVFFVCLFQVVFAPGFEQRAKYSVQGSHRRLTSCVPNKVFP